MLNYCNAMKVGTVCHNFKGKGKGKTKGAGHHNASGPGTNIYRKVNIYKKIVNK